MRVVEPLAVAGTVMLALGPAAAEDRPFFLRLGGAHVGFDESASVSVAGAAVPGGDARLEDNWGIAIEGGYFFTPDISVSLALGVPPTTTVRGAGTLAPAGALGDVTYGPAVLSARYHFLEPGGIRPYVGAGVSYTVIFDTEDKALRNLDVDNALGPALVAGVDVPISGRWGAYVDAKKIWARTDATFDLPVSATATAPGKTRLTLDPLVVSAGISFRF